MGRFSSWRMLGQAPIVSLNKYCKIIKLTKINSLQKLILTSGGFDPVHPGHISVFNDCRLKSCIQTNDLAYAKAYLAVLVNGDEFLKRKKGVGFMSLKVRCQIISAIHGVDAVIPFNPSRPGDMTVCEALKEIGPDVFAKGGDRTNIENIPEWKTCKDYNIEIVAGCGDEKQWSSSNFLKDYIRANNAVIT